MGREARAKLVPEDLGDAAAFLEAIRQSAQRATPEEIGSTIAFLRRSIAEREERLAGLAPLERLRQQQNLGRLYTSALVVLTRARFKAARAPWWARATFEVGLVVARIRVALRGLRIAREAYRRSRSL